MPERLGYVNILSEHGHIRTCLPHLSEAVGLYEKKTEAKLHPLPNTPLPQRHILPSTVSRVPVPLSICDQYWYLGSRGREG